MFVNADEGDPGARGPHPPPEPPPDSPPGHKKSAGDGRRTTTVMYRPMYRRPCDAQREHAHVPIHEPTTIRARRRAAQRATVRSRTHGSAFARHDAAERDDLSGGELIGLSQRRLPRKGPHGRATVARRARARTVKGHTERSPRTPTKAGGDAPRAGILAGCGRNRSCPAGGLNR